MFKVRTLFYKQNKILFTQIFSILLLNPIDRLSALVVRVPVFRSRDSVSITGATRFSEK
jgi:hypothetical protein